MGEITIDLGNIDAVLIDRIYSKFVERIRRSIIQNFRQGGRPNKWTSPKYRKGKPLIDKGILMNSINVRQDGSKIIAGTPVIYAAIHNFGGRITKTITVKSHKRKMTHAFGKQLKQAILVNVNSHSRNMNLNIKKRSYMLLQPSDIAYFGKVLKEELSK